MKRSGVSCRIARRGSGRRGKHEQLQEEEAGPATRYRTLEQGPALYGAVERPDTEGPPPRLRGHAWVGTQGPQDAEEVKRDAAMRMVRERSHGWGYLCIPDRFKRGSARLPHSLYQGILGVVQGKGAGRAVPGVTR